MIVFAIPLTNDVNVGHQLVRIIGCAKLMDGMDGMDGMDESEGVEGVAGSVMRKCPEEKEENDDTGATGQWHRNPSRMQDDSVLLLYGIIGR